MAWLREFFSTLLGSLLQRKAELSETADIQPLFKSCKHLSAYLGTYSPDIGPATVLAFEFPFFGDYRADLIVGSKSAGHYCVVEFEDGKPDSIFKNQPNRKNPEWNRRYEHGISQLTDWFFNLDDFKKSHGFTETFGHGHISFTGLLIIGRSASLDGMKRTRLRWHSDKIRIDSNTIICVTFDDVYQKLMERYSLFRSAAIYELPLKVDASAGASISMEVSESFPPENPPTDKSQ